MTGNAKTDDGDSVRMCATCDGGYYMMASGYSETKVNKLDQISLMLSVPLLYRSLASAC